MEDGKAQFADEAGQKVAAFWRTMYAEGLSPNEKFNGDAFGEQKAAMSIVGPWAIAVYGKDIDWGAAPVPTSAGTPAGRGARPSATRSRRPCTRPARTAGRPGSS